MSDLPPEPFPDVDQPKADNSRQARRARDRDNAMAAMMSRPETRLWLWDLLAACHMNHSSFSNNPNVTAFREGERNIGIQVLAHIQRVAPEQWILMVKENS